MRLPTTLSLVSALALAVAGAGALADDHDRASTATPIKHVVVIFQENVSFDHYFGTYPNARNLPGETSFTASPRTPKVNGLATPLDVNHHFSPLAGVDLLNNNPNSVPTNPAAPNNSKTNSLGASNPFRLSPSQALTADQGHNESPEESAYNNGRMDGFPAFVGNGTVGGKSLVMGYYDGNTVTALWNYAQHFALNDNNYTTQFGPSTPGALNVVSGQTNGVSAQTGVFSSTGALTNTSAQAWGDAAHIQSNITEIGDSDPLLDVCSGTSQQVTTGSKNIGDLLTARNITWGAFMGGFNLSIKNANGTTGCKRSSAPAANPTAFTSDYIPHHAWFQYFVSTRNENHSRPRSTAAIGTGYYAGMVPEPANHNYDILDFYAVLKTPYLPAVS